jgi:putative membrane protein
VLSWAIPRSELLVRLAALVLVGLVALLHTWFLILEMFFWDHRVGRKVFGLDPDFSARSRTLAANQGLYNGFLAAGLLWGAVAAKDDVLMFFLGCVIVAGLYGAMTVKRTILYVQALPALLAMTAVVLSR